MDKNTMVVIALFVVVIGIGLGAWVVAKTPDTANVEISKIRFAAASGILLLIVFASVLYVAYSDEAKDAGKEVFKAIVPAVTPIAAAIAGYLFGSRTRLPRG